MIDQFIGYNAAYIEEQHERFLHDPHSVDGSLRIFFQNWQPASSTGIGQPPAPGVKIDAIIGAANLAEAIRTYGHHAAHLDPLGIQTQTDPTLDAGYYQLDEATLESLPGAIIGGPLAGSAPTALAGIQLLRKIYCGSTGYEYGHIHSKDEREWLRESAECGIFRPPKFEIDRIKILRRLSVVEGFEQFFNRYFPGKTRFSIEGLDMLVLMVDELIDRSLDDDVCMVFLGMAHRGRLNVLAHNLGKPYEEILAEFKDPGRSYSNLDELGWTGDVTYHKGASHAVEGDDEVKIIVCMAPNPSHLEHVNPVIAGMARAGATGTDRPGAPVFYARATLPILIHGDAAFPGEGVVSETLNLSDLEGYQVAGTVHIIANNQLGFTTEPRQGRSTLYASDLARGFDIPILHVNADDPIACLEAARTAIAYRIKFQKDFLIDLVGYRRHGHNEGDEPGFSQPVLYQEIEKHPSVRAIWGESLVRSQEIDPDLVDGLVEENIRKLKQILDNFNPAQVGLEGPQASPSNGSFSSQMENPDLTRLREINQRLYEFPEGFHLHRRLTRPIQNRLKALDQADQASIEWGHAEQLAFATILSEGIPIRLAGQDVERGTFSQRHAVFRDIQTSQGYVPLQNFPQSRASLEVVNSPLSENAALGFEYGFNIAAPDRLVIWEAQYGDFINSAQAVLDEFIISGWAKWSQTPSLVLLLPHGYEGQGPDHSSARIERFLRGSVDNQIRLANCTTAGQYYHLLRLQASTLKTDPQPLVIFTPKSLLRHPKAASTPNELAGGAWRPLLVNTRPEASLKTVDRLLFCSGKIGIDLLDRLETAGAGKNVAIIRIEQLSPFPMAEVQETIQSYSKGVEVFWVQEEPQNMGPWPYIQSRMLECLPEDQQPAYFGRPASSSPAEGSSTRHQATQSHILDEALGLTRLSMPDQEKIR